jgi:hypothetical protein
LVVSRLGVMGFRFLSDAVKRYIPVSCWAAS